MSLQDILFGTFTPPEASNTRTHRIGMCGGRRYEPHKSRVFRTENGLNSSEFQIYELLKTYIKHVAAPDVASLVNMTHSHCGMTLCSLFKKGLLNRYKARKNGTYMYMYCLKGSNEKPD